MDPGDNKISGGEPRNLDDEESVVIYHAPNEIAADLVAQILEDNNIGYMISSQQIPWYDGIMQVAKGYWGDIRVLRSQADEALNLLTDFLNADETDSNPPSADGTT